MEEKDALFEQRLKKLSELREQGINPFPNDFRVTHTTSEIRERFKDYTPEDLKKVEDIFSLAGRIMAIRSFGKASFIHIQDRKGRIQAYIRKDTIGEEGFQLFEKMDIGDFIGVTGKVFITRTGELTIEAKAIRLLSKSLRPLPEKWHGLSDVEIRFRQRYLDLIVNPKVKETFLKRVQIIKLLRDFLTERDFLEVETPMMQPLPGGALAKPFRTHHNALDMDLYLRIAPELYLKRLVVGGWERVFEINRNFRNEGISTQHNPEFTMLEFYGAYFTYRDLMDLTEEMICFVAKEIQGGLKFQYQEHELDFTPPWKRISMKDAILEYGKVDPDVIKDRASSFTCAKELGIDVPKEMNHGVILQEIFCAVVEPHLIQPTFVTDYPVEISPLSRRSDDHPEVTERFELYIAGREIANAFSELNDPLDQRERFVRQMEQKSVQEEGLFHTMDEDFLRALEHGMPPAAGEGIGIDRLVMIMTDSPSIREVILFPLLRSER
ncbi:MAG TPA: lysine--tRNA ligase [Thermodesulfobacteriota bacterium]|nr:lysine--tRNA ligase [Thermodesulfobacteriota bacterium]